jgi:hypothetical protein
MIWGFGPFWALTLYVSSNLGQINLLTSIEPLLSYTDTKDRKASLATMACDQVKSYPLPGLRAADPLLDLFSCLSNPIS